MDQPSQDTGNNQEADFEKIVRPPHEKAAQGFVEWVDSDVKNAQEFQSLKISAYNATDNHDFIFRNTGELEIQEEGDEELQAILTDLDKTHEEKSAEQTEISIGISGNNLELVNDCFQRLVKEAQARGAVIEKIKYPQQNYYKKMLQEGPPAQPGAFAENWDISTMPAFRADASILFR